MFNSVHEFESLVNEILICLNSNKPLSNLYNIHGSQKVNEALYYCSNENLVTGIFPIRVASNDVHIDFTSSPRVTIKGIQYIENFKGEDTSSIAKNAIKKANKADVKSIIAIFISAFSLLVAILSNLDKIHSNIIRVLTYLGLLK